MRQADVGNVNAPDVIGMCGCHVSQQVRVYLVLRSRFPSANDLVTSRWGKLVGQALAMPRWASGYYDNPSLLRKVRALARKRPDDRQAYGHLRDPGMAATAAL